MRSNHNAGNRCWICLIVVVVLLILWPLLNLSGILPGTESAPFLFDRRYFILRALKSLYFRHSFFPSWMPDFSFGFPLAAEPTPAIFYPFDLPFFLMFPPPNAYNFFIVASTVLVGIATFLYAREIGLKHQPSFLAAVSFSFCGYFIGNYWVFPLNNPIFWFPLVLYFFERAMKEKRLIWHVLTGFILGLQFLGGFPQTAFYTWIGFLFYAFVRAFQKERENPDKRAYFFSILFILLTGAGISAIQTLPMAELTRFSFRSGALSSEFALAGSFGPHRLFVFAFPNLLLGNKWDLTSYASLYIGILPLFLIPLTWRHLRNQYVKLFWVMVVFAFFLGLGKYNPLFGAIRLLPGFNALRTPWRILFLADFFLALLGGLGLQFLMDDDKKGKRSYSVRLWIYFLSIMFLIGAGIPLLALAKPFAFLNRPYQFLHTFTFPEVFSLTNPHFVVPLVLVLVFLILFYLYSHNKISISTFLFLILIFTTVDLYVAVSQGKILPPADSKGWLKKPVALSFLNHKKGLFRIYSLPPDFKLTPKDFREYVRETLYPCMNSMYGLSSANSGHLAQGEVWLFPLEPTRILEFQTIVQRPFRNDPGKLSAQQLRLLGLMNVRYLLSMSTEYPTSSSLSLVFHKDKIRVYRNRLALPRAFLVFSTLNAKNRQQALKMISDKQFDPAKEAVIENGSSLSEHPSPSECRVVSYRPTKIIIETKTSQPSWLIVTDTFYPGWEASIDGRPHRIYQADYVFRGVPLRPGKHRVVMRYSSLSLRIGAIMSLFALLGGTIIIISDRLLYHKKRF